uniref:Uncharacterized protein n=1 Tax=Tanacetum cinerariifolium TaxID=118510 RepID=A0A699J0L5_TANCI|nr:hypothetical protein [Tanacetum cinerariifolium]
MSTPTFAETYNLIAFLEKPTESDGFEQIVDFLNANPIKYALIDVRLQDLVDGKKVVVNEASIRRDLRLDDVEGTACLPNAVILEELARMRLKKTQKGQNRIKTGQKREAVRIRENSEAVTVDRGRKTE